MNRLRSFKFKLVAYFVVLSLLPLAAAFYGFSAVTKRSEERRVDARIQAGLRAAVNAYGDELESARVAAERLARDSRVQEALRDGDRATLARIARHAGVDVRFGPVDRTALGPLTAVRTVSVYAGGRFLGDVTVLLHLNGSLLAHLRERTGLDQVDRLVVVWRERVLLGGPNVRGRFLNAPTTHAGIVHLAGVAYRSLASAPLTDPPGVSFVVLSPQSRATSAAAATERRLLAALLASLLLIALVAYILSRSVVARLGSLSRAATAIAAGDLQQRVPVQGQDEFATLGRSFNEMASELESRVDELEAARQRLREAIARFGEALEATHDPTQLRQVIVDSAVQATGAAGGVLAAEGKRVASGDPQAGPARLDLELTTGNRSFGRLRLVGPAFDSEAKETAKSLAGQAVIALENARLHAIVERQAMLDGLTGLANRRRSAEVLHAEVARASRLDAPLAFVLADVDRFKDVNDRYGHPAGDVVLREIATLLSESVREIDLAGRWGGEEFALVLPGTDLGGGVGLAERIRRTLERRPIELGEALTVHVTVSFGVAAYSGVGDEADLVAAADEALYEAKRTGRNRVVAQPIAASQSEGSHFSS